MFTYNFKGYSGKTGFKHDESYWSFNRYPPLLKRYWVIEEVIFRHGDCSSKYLAIELNPATRRMYKKLGIGQSQKAISSD
ncbi:hypothetical protein [Methanobrevibacter sp.]|uniref:hypothetical protein n=1 Tax=Methanobrevibacter sp. TaxID=66852 RepID=UPI0025E6A097|nr:hypothetical protein [Methanobrevibacter sp.]MEE0025759.1 hypothetical protein [Methanobrevibacter sp.]